MKAIKLNNSGVHYLYDKPNVSLRQLNPNNPFRHYPETVERLKALGFYYEGNRSLLFQSSGENIITSGYCFLCEQLHQSFYVVFDEGDSITIINKIHSQLPTWLWRCIHSEADLSAVLKDWGFSDVH